MTDGPYRTDYSSSGGWSATGPGVCIFGTRNECFEIAGALNAAFLLGRADVFDQRSKEAKLVLRGDRTCCQTNF